MSRAALRLSPRQALRRFVGLTALRWFPDGFFVVVVALLASARGLSVADVGMLFAIHGVAIVVFELPTGAIADVIGRQKALIAASLCSTLGTAVAAAAGRFWLFAIAMALWGAGRALASGPLEAWYVDTVQVTDAAADLRPAFASARTASQAVLAIGAALGALVSFSGGPHTDAGGLIGLSVPAVAAAALWAGYGVAVVILVVEPPGPVAPAGTRGGHPLSTGWTALRLASTNSTVRFLLMTTALTGAVAWAAVVLMPLQVAALLRDATDAPVVYGGLLALSYAGGSLTAYSSSLLTRWCKSPAGGAALALLLTAVPVACLAVGNLAGIAVCFVLFQLGLQAASPQQSQLLHGQVGPEHRASLLSVHSMTSQLGGVAGSLALSALAAGRGLPAAWLASGILLALSAVPMLTLRRTTGVQYR